MIDRLEEITKAVDEATDRLGLPIDPGIKKAVIVFNVVGLITEASCEGHMDGGLSWPWIDVGVNDREHNDYLRVVAQTFLDAFYTTREKDLAALQIGFVFGGGTFRIQSVNELDPD